MVRDLLIIGIGNDYRSDDALGLMVVRRLHPPPLVTITEQSGEGAALMDCWQHRHAVILVDAVSTGEPAGKIYRLEAHKTALPTHFFHYSTHAFSVAEAIELARVLQQLPSYFIVYGITGENFLMGQEISPALMGAIKTVVDSINQDIKQVLDN